MSDIFDQFWQQQVEQVNIERPDGLTLAAYLCLPKAARGVVWLSPGRLEAGIKYQELVYELAQQNYACAILDHRGQGHSERESDHPHRGHILDFNDFVSDFAAFVNVIGARIPELPGVLLGHSMGGAIAALYLATASVPKCIQRGLLSAPMIGIHTQGVPEWLIHTIATTGAYLSQWLSPNKPWYFLGKKDYDEVPFADNELTHSETRYAWFRHLYREHPDVQLGGPTYNWVRQAILACRQTQQAARKIQIPVTLLQAGADTIVDLQAQRDFVANLVHPQSTLEVIAGAKHELFMEADRYRQPALQILFHQLQQITDPCE